MPRIDQAPTVCCYHVLGVLDSLITLVTLVRRLCQPLLRMTGLRLSNSVGLRQDLKYLIIEFSPAMPGFGKGEVWPSYSFSHLMKPNFLSKLCQKWPLFGEPLSARGSLLQLGSLCPGIERCDSMYVRAMSWNTREQNTHCVCCKDRTFQRQAGRQAGTEIDIL